MSLLDQVEQYPQSLLGSELSVVSRIGLVSLFVAAEFGDYLFHSSQCTARALHYDKITSERVPMSDLAFQL